MRPPLKYVLRNATERAPATPLPFVALEHIQSGFGKTVVGFEWQEAQSDSNVAFVQDDILFGKLRPYLAKVLWADRPGCCTSELLVLRPVRVLSRYAYWLLLSKPVVEAAVASSTGVKMPRTRWDRLGRERIELPQPEKQRAIAEYLDRETAKIDALIDKREKLIELTEERWQGLLEARIRKLSDGWGTRPLKYACKDIVVGIVVTPSAWYTETGVVAIRGVNVAPGVINLDDVVNLTKEGHLLHQKSRLSAGDVVIVRTGQAGAAAVVPPDLEGANCIDLVIARPRVDLRSQFLEYVLNSDWMQKHVEEHSVGTIQSHFNVGAAKKVPIPMAPLPEQDRAVEDLSRARRSAVTIIEKLGLHVSLLLERRQALISAAIAGRLDISAAA